MKRYGIENAVPFELAIYVSNILFQIGIPKEDISCPINCGSDACGNSLYKIAYWASEEQHEEFVKELINKEVFK